MNDKVKELPIGTSYLCYKCGHTDGDIFSDDPFAIDACPKCGKKDFYRASWGKCDIICFLFTYSVKKHEYVMNKKKVVEDKSVWTLVNGYESGEDCEKDFKDTKLDEKTLVKCVFTWSILEGIYVAQVSGVEIKSGFPFGFNSYRLLKNVNINIFPDYTTIVHKISNFVARYHMGFVNLKGYYAKPSAWIMQEKP
jgi:hypothetical protein